MEKKTKIIIYSVLALLALTSGYFLVRFIKIQKAYKSVLSESQAVDVLEKSTSDVSDTSNNDEYVEDTPRGSTLDDDESPVSGVLIDGVLYYSINGTEVYQDEDGNLYDSNTDSLTSGDNSTYVNPSSVVRGLINSNGSFTML